MTPWILLAQSAPPPVPGGGDGPLAWGLLAVALVAVALVVWLGSRDGGNRPPDDPAPTGWGG